jgi:CRP-like cAMP-binding protein
MRGGHLLQETGDNFVLGAAAHLVPGPPRDLVILQTGQSLLEPGSRFQYAFFPLDGVVSVIASTPRGESVELAGIGAEGVAGSFALPRVQPAFQLVVQIPGRAWRIERHHLDGLLESDADFRNRMMQFADSLVSQLAQSAICCRYHTTEQRIARCLLTMTDRWGRPTVPVTHEFIATLIGAGRPRVTGALSRLGERGVIQHSRGEITVLHREALLTQTCACYSLVAMYHPRPSDVTTPVSAPN